MDRLSEVERSKLMSRVPQRDTAPEMAVRRMLHGAGYRYRVCPRLLPGRPDIAFIGKRKAIFVHGCFWHAHNCRLSKLPSTNSDFWKLKFERNRERDLRKVKDLERLGWTVLVVWQCELKNPESLMETMREFLR